MNKSWILLALISVMFIAGCNSEPVEEVCNAPDPFTCKNYLTHGFRSWFNFDAEGVKEDSIIVSIVSDGNVGNCESVRKLTPVTPEFDGKLGLYCDFSERINFGENGLAKLDVEIQYELLDTSDVHKAKFSYYTDFTPAENSGSSD